MGAWISRDPFPRTSDTSTSPSPKNHDDGFEVVESWSFKTSRRSESSRVHGFHWVTSGHHTRILTSHRSPLLFWEVNRGLTLHGDAEGEPGERRVSTIQILLLLGPVSDPYTSSAMAACSV
jgi:hypothetical protein